ncbi:protein BIG GRAIN 1-like B [Tasmannia lanceolata]|uniref:protein BIG GRAIN 1-like B n=1 Tax=Tasmannia lanceolata TaxID=3420 RepID=UPI004062C473
MDRYEKSLREERSQHRRNNNPSFSSTLLDAIYRSIDEGEEVKEVIMYRETMKNKQSTEEKEDRQMTNLRRACQVEKWMEKKVSEKVILRRKKTSDFEDGFQKLQRDHTSMLFNSTSSSSESSCGGFSSSEAESVYGSRSSVYTSHRPKPIRTRPEVPDLPRKSQISEKKILFQQKPKQEGFIKNKSSEIYGDMKKAQKQPISPGGRLVSFLNSIFPAGNGKKSKISSSIGRHVDDFSLERKSKSDFSSERRSRSDFCLEKNSKSDFSLERKTKSDFSLERKTKSTQASTCSSASSYSRSCLSKTPSSRGKSVNGVKRTVRFYPISVILDEECRPCGQKCIYEKERNVTGVRKIGESPFLLGEELKFHLLEKNKRIEEAAKDLLKGYQKKSDFLGEIIRNKREVEDDDDDDAASYSSSDLFELENLAAIKTERYREELPVYETTHLEKNRAITNGLIL